MQALALGARFVLADVFVLSGLAKLPRRVEFAKAVRAYELVSKAAADRIGRWLPPTELLGGTLLFFGVAARIVAGVLAGLLLVFCLAIGTNLVRGRQIECGCSGDVAPSRIGWGLVVRNLGLAALGVICAIVAAPELSVLSVARYERSAFGFGNAVAIAASVELIASLVLLLTNARRTQRASVSYLDRLEAL